MPDEIANKRTPSTTSAWETVRIKRRRRPPRARVGVADSFKQLRDLKRGEQVTITLVYRGGSECWFQVRARGRRVMRPGWVQLIDLYEELS